MFAPSMVAGLHSMVPALGRWRVHRLTVVSRRWGWCWRGCQTCWGGAGAGVGVNGFFVWLVGVGAGVVGLLVVVLDSIGIIHRGWWSDWLVLGRWCWRRSSLVLVPFALMLSVLVPFMLVLSHNVEVMVYQYDKLFGYGYWMTSISTMSHIFIFLGYSEFPSWLPWQPIQILQYPKSIQQNIKMWDMVQILVIQQPYPNNLLYWYTITSTLWHPLQFSGVFVDAFRSYSCLF